MLLWPHASVPKQLEKMLVVLQRKQKDSDLKHGSRVMQAILCTENSEGTLWLKGIVEQRCGMDLQ